MQSRQDMSAFVVAMLKEKLSPFYFYHDYRHTLYVVDRAIEIGRCENCTEAELELLAAAALWHDTGFLNTYINHEQESCVLARKYLPEYGFSAADTAAVCGMIMATKMPQSPENKLEMIIADADLEYLGTASVEEKAADLYKELQHRTPSLSKTQWNKTQIAFLEAHQYFTPFCKKKKAPAKQAYLHRLLLQNG